MKLGKELAPGVDNLLVGHPLELNETEELSFCPFENYDD